MNYKKLIGAGLAAIGFILFAVLVWPLFGVLSEAREAVDSGQAILDQRKTVIDKMADLKRTVDSQQVRLDQFTSVLPTEKRTHEIIVSIEDMANQSGLELRELKTAEVITTERNRGYEVLQVGIGGSGSYQSVLNFIRSLEKNLRLFDVQSFTVSLDSSTGETTGRLNIDLQLFTYYLSASSQ